MAHERTGLQNIKPEHYSEAERLAIRFPQFTEGVRVLFLIQRHSDGGHTNNSKLRSYVTRDREEWIRALAKLIQEMEFYPDIPLRIYQTINSRNIEKGIKHFKYAMLDADFYDEDTRKWFYIDVRNRFISSIMKHSNKETSYFLFDCDTQDIEIMVPFGQKLAELTEIVECYPSKKGFHLITKPFNYTKLERPAEIGFSPDAMMLLKWSVPGFKPDNYPRCKRCYHEKDDHDKNGRCEWTEWADGQLSQCACYKYREF